MTKHLYSQEEFDALPRGEGCSFGERCSHEGLTNSRYIAIDRIGSSFKYVTVDRIGSSLKAEEGFFVRAGCWFGSFAEFEARVKEVHGGTKHERHYLKALELAKLMLEDDAPAEPGKR